MVQDNARVNNYKFNNYCRTAPTGPKRLRNLLQTRAEIAHDANFFSHEATANVSYQSGY